jgi:hypothetical protein
MLLNGQEFYQAGNTSADGIAILLGQNRGGSGAGRQMWIADSAALAQNTTNSVIRLGVGTTSNPFIDAISTDGSTPKDLRLGVSGSNILIGASAGWAGQTTFDANVKLQGPNSSSARAKAFAWDVYSDERLKYDPRPVAPKVALEKIRMLQLLSYMWREGQGDNFEGSKPSRHLGLYADNVAKAIACACGYDDDGNAISFDPGKIAFLAVGAIQELDQQAAYYEKRLTALENQLTQLTQH